MHSALSTLADLAALAKSQTPVGAEAKRARDALHSALEAGDIERARGALREGRIVIDIASGRPVTM